MYLTEDEAKAKLCVRTMHLEKPLMCDGSSCMAWLWVESKFDREKGVTTNEKGRCGLVNVCLDSDDRVR